MNGRCLEVWQSDEDGWVYTCDLEHEHVGTHEACDYDPKKGCFREARWPLEPPVPLVRFVSMEDAQKALEPVPRLAEEQERIDLGRRVLALPGPSFDDETINHHIALVKDAIERVVELGESGFDVEAWDLLQDLRTKYWAIRRLRGQLDDAKQAQYDDSD